MKQHHFNIDKVVREFGINITEELALVNARVLPPPTVYIGLCLIKFGKLPYVIYNSL